MSQNLEVIKTKVEIAQIIIVCLALFIGGGWTLYTFISLEQVKKAKTELEELKKKLIEQALLEIEITAQSKKSPSVKKQNQYEYFISATIKVTNKGTRNAYIEFSNPPLLIAKVDGFDADGSPILGKIKKFGINLVEGNLSNVILIKNETASYPFWIKVSEPGLYYLEFSFPQEKQEQNLFPIQATIPKEEIFMWYGGVFLKVE